MAEIVELTSEADWRAAHPCLESLRSELDLDGLLERRESLQKRDYHLLGVRDGEKVLCVAGYVLQPHIERDTEFWLHDFVTLPAERSKGYGLAMIRHLEKLAFEAGCARVLLHTRLGREAAKGFYRVKAHYEDYALVFKKELCC